MSPSGAAGELGPARILRAGAATQLLTTIADVRALPAELAREGWPVRVRGVVTYADNEWGRLFVQDQDAALAIDIRADPQAYARGEVVEVAGWTGVSYLTSVPMIVRPTIERRGATPLATPPA